MKTIFKKFKKVYPNKLDPVKTPATFSKCFSLHVLHINISSVVEFQRWWVLKSKFFGQESTCHQGKIIKKFLQVMTVCQKVPKLYFQSQFWTSKIDRIYSKKIIYLRISI